MNSADITKREAADIFTIAPQAPAVVAIRFGAYAAALSRYANWLAGAATLRGLIGPREVDRLWERHILNSVALSELLPLGARIVDVGSGAGLPGLAIACVRPDLRVDLVEPLLRRTTFLDEVVADLAMVDQVRVVRGRADDPQVVQLIGNASFVTARAVAPLDKLLSWTRPLLKAGGSLFAIKGQSAEAELSAHRVSIERSRTDIVGVVECGADLVTPAVRVIHLRRR